MNYLAKRKFGKVMWSFVCVITLLLIDGQAVGQPQLDRLLASDGMTNDFFGYSVSISGPPGNEVAIVGAKGDADNGVDSGSAYIFRRSGASWVQEAKLLASDGAASDVFGASVSISGTPGNEVAIVGAYFDDMFLPAESGAAYIYRFNGVNWVEEQKLLASDGAAGDKFGPVSIIGTAGNEVAIVGAWLDDDNGSNSGSAYIYRYNGVAWVEEAKLLASDGAADDLFGYSVSIGGPPGNEVAIVGAYKDDDIEAKSGSAYIYRFNGTTWVEEQKLLASDSTFQNFFGYSVSISGPTGNVVAIGRLPPSAVSGSAYIFRFNGVNWVEEQKLLTSNGTPGDQFGRSVSISGNAVIVGSFRDDDGSVRDSGSAYIFRFDGASWGEEQKLLNFNERESDFFGFSVSIRGDIAIVGAIRDDFLAPDRGLAYSLTGLFVTELTGDCNSNGINDLHDLFVNKTSADCNDNGIPDECDIASGVSVDVDVDGIPDECLASCPPDVNSDGTVNVTDLLALLAAWGVCP